jgi:4'-phosphopantetheinyl transferase
MNPGEEDTYQPAFPADEVHVWSASLNLPDETLARFTHTLSHDELERAARYALEKPRQQFIAARGILRELLGRYLDIPPGEVHFQYTPRGKPLLAIERPGHELQFNLAHSEGRALLAFALRQHVGVDLEKIRTVPDAEAMAARYFTPEEAAEIRTGHGDEQSRRFFNCWTRKEAYLKALGEGFAIPPDSFQVSLLPGEPARLIRVAGNPGEPARWEFNAWEPFPGWVAALAIEGRAGVLVTKEYIVTH